jgi:sulfate adenylyltransferase subunit 1 (EFTu-like GTPase family)
LGGEKIIRIHMDVLKITAGSVDDGKSTLIGRLYDTNL